MTRSPARASLLLALIAACLMLVLSVAVVSAEGASARAAVGAKAQIAKKKKKKCKIWQKRNSRGKCVTKKCKKGYKLSKKKGKCLKVKSGGGSGNPVPDRSDADGDGIPLWRETKLGSSPTRKDIFVQLNFESPAIRASIPCSELDKLVDVFATAPVSNPSGQNGITLHLDAGVTCPSRSYALGQSKIFTPDNPCPTFRDVGNGEGLPDDRVGVFHVSAVVDTCSQGEGGSADFKGIHSVVFTSGSGFAMSFMHELGHNLGLDHLNNPNRRSVMNGRMAKSATGSGSEDFIDYQRYALPALDEANLSEAAGIGVPAEAQTMFVNYHCGTSSTRSQWLGYASGAIDWNCSAVNFWDPPDIDGGTVAADINGDGAITVLPATPNEWDILDYSAGGNIAP